MKKLKPSTFLAIFLNLSPLIPSMANADIRAWLSQCMQSLTSKVPDNTINIITANSGFVSDFVAAQIVNLPVNDGHSSYVGGGHNDSTWHSNYPIILRHGLLFYLSVDSRIYEDLSDLRLKEEFAIILESRQNPMAPIAAKNGGYIVYMGFKKAQMWAGRHDHFALFSSLENALSFTQTHSFQSD